MQQMTHYHHLVHDVSSELTQLSHSAQKEGIPKWLQVLDPGIGFAKTMEQNLCLIQQFREMNRCIGSSFPIVFGPSRKGFIGKVTGESKPEERDFGTIACCLIGTQNLQGNPVIVRVHNVRAMKHAYRIMEAIENASM
jgi:2-amino-4-hydroxy-6-hydroxymethyldihydropteridine diphosphokinase/dihydropteroate synthase